MKRKLQQAHYFDALMKLPIISNSQSYYSISISLSQINKYQTLFNHSDMNKYAAS